MTGIVRYGKSLAAAAALSLFGFVGRFGFDWVLPHVDPLPGPGVTLVDAPRAKAPLRQVDDTAARWRLCVVTNRTQESAAPAVSEKSLSEQVADAIYRTAANSYQICEVSVPLKRRRGDCPIRDEASDCSCDVVISETADVDAETFYDVTRKLSRRSGTQDVFVMVHGFNVTLDHAIARAAQVAEDMPFNGVVVVFSWRSLGRTLAYREDEMLAERHFWGLAELLHTLRKTLPEESRLHLLAHSMGNRVTLRALNSLAGTIDPVGQPIDMFVAARLQNGATLEEAFKKSASVQSGVFRPHHEVPERFPLWAAWREQSVSSPPLGSLILAAPDVGVSEFQRFVADTRHLTSSVTVYTSGSDLALEASGRIHDGGFRAGDSRSGMQIPGVQMIRVSAPSSSDWLGHSYYGSNPTVLSQLHRLTRTTRLTSSQSALR